MHTNKHRSFNTRHQISATNRILALLLTFTVLLPSITPYGTTWANNRGPNAPEAASFEPVDATDMVNLLTGDFSYVLPLMNVPSPEGGYPIALAYHGGIAMDLESSWVGLGWNLNPGAINRTVNGYPDDYSSSILTDYFYDSGGENVTYYAGVGYSYGGVSVGVGYAWGSNQSSSGYVSVGYGVSEGFGANVKIGINQESSVGIGFQFASGLSLGASLSTNGTASGTVGFDNNGVGFSVGASTDGTYQASIKQTGDGYSMGINLSSKGPSLIVSYKDKSHGGSGSVGIGAHTVFNTTAKQSDYTIRQSGYNYGIIIPTYFGVFSFSWGKQKVIYYSAKETNTLLTGPLKFGEKINSEWYWSNFCSGKDYLTCSEYIITEAEAFMDIYEIPLDDANEIKDSFNIVHNNPVLPSYDKYNVQAQGLSGSIHATLVDNGRLFGLSKETEDIYVRYEYDGFYDDEDGELDENLFFRKRPEFYFDNEITSYLNTPKAIFDDINSTLAKSSETYDYSIKDIFNKLENDELTTNRFKKGNYIEYATNFELLTQVNNTQEFLEASISYDRSTMPASGIGAYKITAVDGKTYHYSLPVYNHETVTRTYGLVEERPEECESYLEKRQLEPYATHWLLTAVTGADFVDNGDGVAGEGDLGYWVNFDYGLWSDAYVWSPHPDKPYIEDIENSAIKTWVKGRKQLYYLDKISTRTHTAVFIKSEEESNPSLDWEYKAVANNGERQRCETEYTREASPAETPDFYKFGIGFINVPYFRERFNIPAHNRLKLDRVLLVKNENFNLQKARYNTSKSVEVYFNDSDKSRQYPGYDLNQNVYDSADNWETLKPDVIKEVVFDQDYQLSNKQLTLKSVDFKGKQEAGVLPPYQFEYIEDDQYSYDIDDANDWGYYKENSELWSLKKIITPQGGEVQVDYEPHNFRSVINHQYIIENNGFDKDNTDEYTFVIEDFDFYLGAEVKLAIGYKTDYRAEATLSNGKATIYSYVPMGYTGKGIVTDIITLENGNQQLYVEPVGSVTAGNRYVVPYSYTSGIELHEKEKEENRFSYVKLLLDNDTVILPYLSKGGVRVESITTTDGMHSFSSEYGYGENGDGLGWVTYVPYAPKAQKEVPYSSELPPSRPMYEYVTHTSKDNEGNTIGTTQYHYNVLKDKTLSENKYGDFYELASDRHETGSIKEFDEYKKTIFIDEYTIHDNLGSIGQLLSVSTYNNRYQLLSKLTNQYYRPEDLPDDIGTVQESYQSYKRVIFKPYDYFRYNDFYKGTKHWMVNSSTRIKYPSILKSSTELKNGVSYTTTFSDFDLTLGQAKQTHSKSSLGLEMKTVSEPAFYHYPEMGSKADDINNKNMLSQGAQTLSYFKSRNSGYDWELYAAEVDTWKPYVYKAGKTYNFQTSKDTTPTAGTSIAEKNVWRKHQKYIWQGPLNESGSYKDFTNFNWDSDTQATDWKKVSEITKYSDYSRALETMDINGNRSSLRLGDDSSKVIAVSNAPYDQMYCANFEYIDADPDPLNGGFYIGGERSSEKAHTGRYSIKITIPNFRGVYALIPNSGNYKASVWVHKDNYTNIKLSSLAKGLIDFDPNEIVMAGNWIQLNFKFKLDKAGTIALVNTDSGEAYYDDFRIHPADASMTSYVYNEWDELSYLIGPNNMATKYEYDDSGRLYKTYVEVPNSATIPVGGFKEISKTNYNYKNQ